MRPPGRYVTWYVGEIPTCSSERLRLFGHNNFLKAVGRTQREAARCMRERLIGTQIESCALGALQARSEEHLKHSDR